MKYIIHTDGGARGNPGPAAVGVVIEKAADPQMESRMQKITEFGKKIGETTNNTAEYVAVIEALKYCVAHAEELDLGKNVTLDFYLDSTLVVNQLNGLYKVKQAHLRELLTSVRFLEAEAGANVKYIAVPREQNRRADSFVNQALDA